MIAAFLLGTDAGHIYTVGQFNTIPEAQAYVNKDLELNEGVYTHALLIQLDPLEGQILKKIESHPKVKW